jgi:hypothetical protein
VPHYHYYEKAFFLGEDQIFIDGIVVENYDHHEEHSTPKKFDRIFVRTARIKNVEGWEIEGINKGDGKFEVVITTTANGVTISKETIINNNSRITEIEFYLDDEDIYSCPAYYKEKSRYTDGYDCFYYDYAHVAEAMDLSGTHTVEHDGPPWDMINTYHSDLNFSKPGWYKIVRSDGYPINNDSKHYSGKNTNLER